MQLQLDPFLDAEPLDVRQIDGPRAKCQAIEHMHRLFIGGQLLVEPIRRKCGDVPRARQQHGKDTESAFHRNPLERGGLNSPYTPGRPVRARIRRPRHRIGRCG